VQVCLFFSGFLIRLRLSPLDVYYARILKWKFDSFPAFRKMYRISRRGGDERRPMSGSGIGSDDAAEEPERDRTGPYSIEWANQTPGNGIESLREWLRAKKDRTKQLS